jgi:hypothetical protein
VRPRTVIWRPTLRHPQKSGSKACRLGSSSCSSPSRFAASSDLKKFTPVIVTMAKLRGQGARYIGGNTYFGGPAMPILAASARGALLACSLRRGLDRVRRQLVEGLDYQRRQRQRVGLGWVLAVGTGDHDHSRRGGRPQVVRRVLHGRSVGLVDTPGAWRRDTRRPWQMWKCRLDATVRAARSILRASGWGSCDFDGKNPRDFRYLTMDHFVPKAKPFNGTDNISNLPDRIGL